MQLPPFQERKSGGLLACPTVIRCWGLSRTERWIRDSSESRWRQKCSEDVRLDCDLLRGEKMPGARRMAWRAVGPADRPLASMALPAAGDMQIRGGASPAVYQVLALLRVHRLASEPRWMRGRLPGVRARPAGCGL